MNQFDFTKTPGKARKRFYSPSPEKALISIVTPFYNAGKYFEQTFNSVMNQTFPWFEWIIVDDGSTEKEDLALLDFFAQKDDRISIVHQKNGGPSKARNTGFSYAKTNLVVPLDSDDLLAPQYLECLYWTLYYHPDAAWAYTDSYGFHDQEYIWKKHFSARQMKTENLLVATAMIRKKDFDEIGGYKIEERSYNEDWRFWLDMLAEHKKPVHIGAELFWYRRMDTGRLSSVEGNEEKAKFSENIIKEAAERADESVCAIEYPGSNSGYSFYKPMFFRWEHPSQPDKKKKRVLWLLPWMAMGGADKFNLDAISGLNKRGYENYILTTLASDNSWKQKFEELTDEIFCMAEFLDPIYYPEFVSYFIQSRQIDVLIVSNSYDAYYMLPWLRQHFPDLAIIDYVHMEEWYWRAGGYARLSSALSGISEKTYVCNSATRQVMTEHFGCDPENVSCMYIGVDGEYYSKDKELPGYLHKLIGIPEGRPIVLFPCRIHPQKRPFMVLDIAKLVRNEIPDVAFVVVGDGPDLEEMKRAIRKRRYEDTIYCIGRSDQMRACYRDSRVTLICSLKEGLALTAYESCAMGVPVVSSDVGGQRDLIGSDVGALIPLQQSESEDLGKKTFPLQEVEAFAKEIIRIVSDSDLSDRLGRQARSKIEKGFTIEKMVEHLDRELKKICSDVLYQEKRRKMSEVLQMAQGYAADYYTIYHEWKIVHETIMNTQKITFIQRIVGRLYNQENSKLAKLYKQMIQLPGIGHGIQWVARAIWYFGN